MKINNIDKFFYNVMCLKSTNIMKWTSFFFYYQKTLGTALYEIR